MYESQKKEIETIKDRTLILKLSDADCDRILQKAAGCGLTVSELLASFIGDLIDGTYTNGSDERMLAQDWFDRCGFRQMADRTLLRFLLERGEDIENFLYVYDENEEYKSHPEEFEELREDYGLAPNEPFDFEDELSYLLNDWKTNRASVDMDVEIENVRAYLRELKSFKGE